MKQFVTFCRIFVGILFIISGLIKANDPVGFSIKLEEYFTVFEMEFFVPFALALSVFITVFEIICGVATLIGSRMKLFSWLLLLMIIFFTFLTFYSAYFNKVTDCGCFGDAIKLTPWQSFTKDVILVIFILPIFLYRNKILPLFNAKTDNIILIVSTIVSTWFNLNCINHLPAIDFRAYKIGTDILKGMEIPEGAPTDSFEIKLVYKNLKTGQSKEFSQQEYMTQKIWEDSATWKYENTLTKLVRKGYEPPIHGFKIEDENGEDRTLSILQKSGYKVFLIAHNLLKSNIEVQPQVNELQQYCEKNNIPFIAITNTVGAEKEKFRHENQNMFPYYNCDETALKTMIRSNPGIILLKDAKVIDMWHYNDIPSGDELKQKYFSK